MGEETKEKRMIQELREVHIDLELYIDNILKLLMDYGMSEQEAYAQALEWIRVGTEDLDLGDWSGSREEEWLASGTEEEYLEESLYNDTQINPTRLHDVDSQVTEIVDRIAATNRLIKSLTPSQKENVKSLLNRQGHM